MCVLITPGTMPLADENCRYGTQERTSTLIDGHAERRGDLLLQIHELRMRVAQLELRTRRSRTRWNGVWSSTDRQREFADEMPDPM